MAFGASVVVGGAGCVPSARAEAEPSPMLVLVSGSPVGKTAESPGTVVSLEEVAKGREEASPEEAGRGGGRQR